MAKETDLELSVGLTVDDAKKSAESLAKSVKKIFNDSAGTKLDSKLQQTQKQLAQNTSKADQLVKKLDELENKKIATPEYTKATKELDSLRKQYEKFQENTSSRMEQLKAKAERLAELKTPTAEYKKLENQMNKLKTAYDEAEKSFKTAQAALNANKRYQAIPEEIKKAEESLKELQRIREEDIVGNKDRFDSSVQYAKALSDVDKEIQKAKDLIASLNNEQIKLEEASGIAEFGEKADDANIALEKVQDQMAKLEAEGKAFDLGSDSEQYKNVTAQIDAMTQKSDKFTESIAEAEQNVKDLVDAGKDFTLGSDTAEYQKTLDALVNTNNQVRIGVNHWEQLNDTSDKTSKSMDRLSNSTRRYANEARKASKHSLNFNNSIKQGIRGILRYVLGISSLVVLFNKLRAAAKEGINSFVKWEGQNGQLNKSISMMSSAIATLKNNIGAMVVPLVNALAPAITNIINLLSQAIQKISMFIALLSGKSTIMVADKVQKNYAASLDKTAGSAKKAAKALKGYLSPLDEINKYEKQDDNSGGGGGGIDTGSFHEVPVDPKLLKWFEDLKNKLQELKDKIKPFWDAFKEGFKKGLGEDWKEKIERIKNALGRIKDTLKDIWNDPEVTAARDRYLLSLAEMAGAVAGTWARIGLNIGVNLTEGIAQALEEKKDEIKEYLVDMFDIGTEMNKQVEAFALAIGEISDVLTGENAVNATAKFTEIFLEAFMLITENAAKLGLAILELITQPIIDNKDKIKRNLDDMFAILAEFADFVQGLIKDIRDILKQVWEDHINPMFESLTRGISNLVGIILDAWNDYVSPIIHEVISAVSELWNTYLKPIFEDIINIITTLAHLVAMFYENVVVPHIKEFVEKHGPKIRDVINILISVFKLAFEIVSIGLGTITGLLRAVLEFLEVGFTQGWDKAWEHLKESFSEMWDEMLEKVKGVFNTIVEIVEKVVNAIVRQINSLGGKIGDKLKNVEIPEWLGGGKINIEIPELPEIHIPRLAKGAVIPPNKEFLAMLGDQKSGTNIETPLSTMMDAFRQVMRETGGGNGTTTIQIITPDKQKLAEYVVEGGKVLQMSTGNNIFELAGV